MTETELRVNEDNEDNNQTENHHDELEELNLDEKPTLMVPVKEPPIDLHEAQLGIIQTITRQNYGISSITSVSTDFYDLIAELQHKGIASDNLVINKLEKFINTRISRILLYSSGFSDSVLNSLSIEEKDMYMKITEAVTDFRNEVWKKLNLT